MSAMAKIWAADPGEIASMRDAMVKGERDPRQVLDATLTRIQLAEPAVRGWRLIDEIGAQHCAARLADRAREKNCGPLHGIPVAIKDVIDVEGWPTRAGSRSRENAPPCSADATIVARLRAAGAVIVGKAHTTEFAFFDGAPPTRNPYDLTRTPGGSSSGPAAVVAAGMMPLSLGTQTAGSVSRPAAYCGIAAFKPSTLSWPGFGMVPFAPSFDTVGVFGFRVADAVFAARALMPPFLQLADTEVARPRIVILQDPLLSDASRRVASLGSEIGCKLGAAGYSVANLPSPVSFAALNNIHLTIREYELGHAHAGLLEVAEGMVVPSLRDAVARGFRIERQDYLAALMTLHAMQAEFWQAMSPGDVVVFPAAPDIAPQGMATGDARFVIPLTALGGPIMSVPVGFDRGMPVGVMMTAAPGSDRLLLDISARLGPHIETPRNITRGGNPAPDLQEAALGQMAPEQLTTSE